METKYINETKEKLSKKVASLEKRSKLTPKQEDQLKGMKEHSSILYSIGLQLKRCSGQSDKTFEEARGLKNKAPFPIKTTLPDNKAFNLENYLLDSPAFIVFISLKTPDARSIIRKYDQLATVKKEKLKVVAVIMDADRKTLKSLSKELKLKSVFLVEDYEIQDKDALKKMKLEENKKGRLSTQYKIFLSPTTFLVDGSVLDVFYGYSKNQLKTFNRFLKDLEKSKRD